MPAEIQAEIDNIRGWVKAARQLARLTQSELAHASGVSENTLGSFERGERALSLPNLIAVMYALDLSWADFNVRIEIAHKELARGKEAA